MAPQREISRRTVHAWNLKEEVKGEVEVWWAADEDFTSKMALGIRTSLVNTETYA